MGMIAIHAPEGAGYFEFSRDEEIAALQAMSDNQTASGYLRGLRTVVRLGLPKALRTYAARLIYFRMRAPARCMLACAITLEQVEDPIGSAALAAARCSLHTINEAMEIVDLEGPRDSYEEWDGEGFYSKLEGARDVAFLLYCSLATMHGLPLEERLEGVAYYSRVDSTEFAAQDMANAV